MKIYRLIMPLVLLILLTSGCGLSSGCGGFGPVGPGIVPYEDSNFTIDPFYKYTVTVNVKRGAIIEGYLTVRGVNDYIRFYIEDSFGNKVLDINRVNWRYDFMYTVQSDGFHTMFFDNSFSWYTSKQVFLHYRVR